ncbi:Uncharacterised protein [Streptococcus pasteurianus]|jgi:hypothetical protein|uniref:Putative extracellular protein n=1 Tax=Streptococcus pasteurianus (strain ATCC 43144 / JCM 5346 / CCUG 46074 / CDC 1723-81) TaxID=981540 RepID=F5X5Z3_STRPX|nr:putative extracellular protein [Streptococcus pasteurianus ATCC 43144]VUW97883.1 Uncharacterised protein [Streptococcus pasteurianus]
MIVPANKIKTTFKEMADFSKIDLEDIPDFVSRLSRALN